MNCIIYIFAFPHSKIVEILKTSIATYLRFCRHRSGISPSIAMFYEEKERPTSLVLQNIGLVWLYEHCAILITSY